MKKLSYLIVLALILGLVLTGCLLSNVGQVPTSEQSGVAYLTKGPSPGLVGLWHLDESTGTTAYDSSGNDNDGMLKPTGLEPTWISGKFGNALSFDDIDDYVDCGSNVGSFDLSDPFTIEAWINPALDNADDVIYGNAWGEQGYHVRVTSANKVRFILVETGSNYKGIDSSVLTPGWHHIAAVWDGASVKIYVDGEDDSQTPIVGGTVTTITTVVNTKIGLDTAAAAHYFDGIIDEVRIWDEALTAEQIRESYSLGAIEFTKELTEVSPEPVDWVDDIPQVLIDTQVTFTMPITVNNHSLLTLNDARVKDRLGAELEVVPHEVGDPFDETIGEATYYTKGNSKKVFIDWDLEGPLSVEAQAILTIVAKTDINPGGGKKTHQEYTSPGEYELNSGATLTFYVTVAGEDISLVVTTDGLWVKAFGVESD